MKKLFALLTITTLVLQFSPAYAREAGESGGGGGRENEVRQEDRREDRQENRQEDRGSEAEIRGREAENEIRGREAENEVRGRESENEVRGRENEIRGREAEGEIRQENRQEDRREDRRDGGGSGTFVQPEVRQENSQEDRQKDRVIYRRNDLPENESRSPIEIEVKGGEDYFYHDYDISNNFETTGRVESITDDSFVLNGQNINVDSHKLSNIVAGGLLKEGTEVRVRGDILEGQQFANEVSEVMKEVEKPETVEKKVEVKSSINLVERIANFFRGLFSSKQ